MFFALNVGVMVNVSMSVLSWIGSVVVILRGTWIPANTAAVTAM
jgi:hypothetical protein